MPDDPTGGVVQNLFRLRHLENAVGDEAEALLRDLFDEIADAIQRQDVGGSGPPQTGKLQRLMDEVEELTGARFEEARELIAGRATDIGLDQARFAGRQLDRALRGVTGVSVTPAPEVVSRRQIEAIVRSRPFEGKVLRSWAKTEEQAVIHRVRRQVQLGMSQQETLGDIVRRVRGTQQGFIRQDPDTGQFVPQGTRGADVRPRFVGGVLNQTTRETEAIVRTAINHTATQGHLETYRANRDVTKTYTYTAVLDARTTQICMGLDGRTWAYDEPGRKEPPQHFGCRSILTPNVDWDGLGVEPPDTGTRASADGQVPADTTYEDWLRDQDKATQVEILGEDRANLFRANRIGLRDLVKGDNRRRSVDELRQLAGFD